MVPQQQALEKDTAYTRALERGVPPGASDNSGTLRRYYAPEALAAHANRKKEEQAASLIDPRAQEERESDIRLLTMPFGMVLPAFASAVVPVGSVPGLIPFALPKGMIVTKEGKIEVLGTPGGVGGDGDRLGGMQRDTSANRPHIEGMGVASAANGPALKLFWLVLGKDVK